MNYRFTLDMQTVQSQVSLPVSLNDTARTLYISFTEGGKPYTIEVGCLAKLTISRPSGSKKHEFCPIQGNTTVVYSFDLSTASEEGIHDCEITLYDRHGGQITAPRFNFVVSDRVVDIDDNNGLTEEHLGIIDEIVHKEIERQVAEEVRVISEEGRVAAEETRVASEEGRVAAEETRTATFEKIEHDTFEAVSRILDGQKRIIDAQNKLLDKGQMQEKLSAIIDLQESYIGGGNG